MIDITMTAVIRPAVLERTLSSFCKHLFGDTSNYRLVVNIDPVSNGKDTLDDVFSVIYKYFNESNVIYNTPSTPHFGKAAYWCFNNINNSLVFHLEDDWELTTDIDINDLINIHKKNNKIACVRLVVNKGIRFSNKNTYKKDGSSFFKMSNTKHGLPPALFKLEYLLGYAKVMNPNKNPELQAVHAKPGTKLYNYLSGWEHVLYNNKENPIVENIGKDWREKLNLTRKKSDFVVWT